MNRAALSGQLESHETLGQVLRWNLAQRPRAEFVDVVIQDEYSHDVVVRISDHVFAVYATTCLGAVLSVTVWDHQPSARELLVGRLARGWRPTPTATREGLVVLGYAACAAGCTVSSVA
jgi:hypothetical protein